MKAHRGGVEQHELASDSPSSSAPLVGRKGWIEGGLTKATGNEKKFRKGTISGLSFA